MAGAAAGGLDRADHDRRGRAVPAFAWTRAGRDLAVPLGLLLNELVSNSLKHAFPEGRRGTIRVRLAPEAGEGADANGEMLRLTVHDDGIGLPPEADRTSPQTLGLRLVAALSEQLHAKLEFENRNGACVMLVFYAGANGRRGAGHAGDALSRPTLASHVRSPE
jgi:two-component sensor histidine kinase